MLCDSTLQTAQPRQLCRTRKLSDCEILCAIAFDPRGRQHRHTPVVPDWLVVPLILVRTPSAPDWMRLALGHLSLPIGYRFSKQSDHLGLSKQGLFIAVA